MYSVTFCALVFCALLHEISAKCRSDEILRSSSAAKVAQAGRTMSRTTASKIIGGRRPCGGSVCSSCRQDLNYPVITRRWGKFGITGHPGMIALLDTAFVKMGKENPALLGRIGSAGGVCCRLTRRPGGSCGSSYSIHSYGLAVDLKIDGYLDRFGDGCVHKPLFEVHKYLRAVGFYWGKDFSNEDAMHWEVSNEVGLKWLREGVPKIGDVVSLPPLDRCKAAHGDKASCKNVATCTGKDTAGLCPGPKAIRCCYDEQAAPPPPEKCEQVFGKDAKCVAAASCTKGVQKPGASFCRDTTKVCCTPDLCAPALGAAAKCVAGDCDGRVEVDLCSPGTKCCAPIEDSPPLGSLKVENNVVSGWACDANSPDTAIDVHVYVGGEAGAAGIVGTSLRRSCPQCLSRAAPADVDRAKCACAGDCKVGFELELAFIDGLSAFAGQSVKIYAYAINEGVTSGQNMALANSPVTISIPAEIEPEPTVATTQPSGTPDKKPSRALYDPVALPACFAPTACDSSLPCCAFCSVLPQGAPCRDAPSHGCKKASVCDGINPYCPSRERMPASTPCDDGNACTGPDVCTLDGTCFGAPLEKSGCGCKTDEDCDDGNACSMNKCDTATGKCSWQVDVSAAGKLCRRSRSFATCDTEEFCTGKELSCPEDIGGCLREEFDGDEDPGFEPVKSPGEEDGKPSDGCVVRVAGALVAVLAVAQLL